MHMRFSVAEHTMVNQTDKMFCSQETYIPVGKRQTINIKVNKKRSLVISNQVQKSPDMVETDRRATLAKMDREGLSEERAVSRGLSGTEKIAMCVHIRILHLILFLIILIVMTFTAAFVPHIEPNAVHLNIFNSPNKFL